MRTFWKENRANPSRAETNPACSRRGAVLVIVLVLVIMIALAGFGFLAEMTVEYEAANIGGDLLQAQQTMASAESWLLSVAEQQATGAFNDRSLQNNPEMFQARTLLSRQLEPATGSGLESANTQTLWRFAVVADPPDAISNDFADQIEPQYEADEAFSFQELRFGLQNESARLHLGKVLEWELAEPGRGRRALLQISGMTDETADAILDWIDSDDQRREFGAEADYYQRLDHPLNPRNGLPDTLEELLFVKGVTREMFYGRQSEPIAFGAESARGWRRCLTVHSAERNSNTPDGSRIRLNEGTEADLQSLEHQLGEFLPEDVARYVVLARMFGVAYVTSPGIAPLEVDLAGMSTESLIGITNLSDLLDSSVQLPKSDGGQLVNSPLATADAASLNSFRLLEERTTARAEPVIIGRINLNDAPEEVLRSLTDDPAMASQIVLQRQTVDEQERRSTLWLLTRQVVDLPMYRSIYRDLTTGGNVYSAEILVYRPIGGPFLRRKVTIDAANESVRRVSWLDKTEMGLPVSIRGLESASTTFER
jgi:type II secretory pathway component PulK